MQDWVRLSVSARLRPFSSRDTTASRAARRKAESISLFQSPLECCSDLYLRKRGAQLRPPFVLSKSNSAEHQLVPAGEFLYRPECLTSGADLRSHRTRSSSTGHITSSDRPCWIQPVENVIAKK